VKSRIHTTVGTAVSTVKSVLARSPEPVRPAAAVGDGTKLSAETSEPGDRQEQPDQPGVAVVESAEPPVIDDRRKKDRRRGALPTTLDTRKGGIDRRTKGRISLKV
jgi:hypothetical protein